ncbi:hypothetical protein [Thermoflavimicrobium daqui]|jgi:hypothetical protein|uniref:ATP-binding protein n=1 Tax=Thermoflavimicrobium daqui TaxID=2137476 RepID=A0A364K7Y6_9BACL|nr:hypothetical protein [Thermoflavimicrobium daqui]RAL26388.1 hypothetical protein DL897_05195 [Thermoflavimicrobium daqui]
MLQIFSEAKLEDQELNRLVVFDEAHKYIEDLVSELVEVVWEMRHKGTNIMVASQDPPELPKFLIQCKRRGEVDKMEVAKRFSY